MSQRAVEAATRLRERAARDGDAERYQLHKRQQYALGYGAATRTAAAMARALKPAEAH